MLINDAANVFFESALAVPPIRFLKPGIFFRKYRDKLLVSNQTLLQAIVCEVYWRRGNTLKVHACYHYETTANKVGDNQP